MANFTWALVGLLLICVASCDDDNEVLPTSSDEYNTYIFLGHTYHWIPPCGCTVDDRLERVDYNKYDGIWLGGDVCRETTHDESTVEYLDSLFQISSPSTLWAAGNHDLRNGNWQFITDKTQRETFYTWHNEGITFVVLNTVLGHHAFASPECESRREQFDMFEDVLDTIENSKNLVILSHEVIWGWVEKDEMESFPNANADKSGWYSFLCDTLLKFESHFYPKLVDVKNRGIDVMFISGDGGQYSKKYEYTTKEDIHFLISGINNTADSIAWPPAAAHNFNPDTVLIINHDLLTHELSWSWVELNEL